MDYPSPLDQELALLDPQRRRILLVVGSYDEAAVVREALVAALGPGRESEVLVLVPETEGGEDEVPGTLRRSLLQSFPERDARFLIAPLLAIERGHNILVGTQAALGSVYFLVRPMPLPGDPHTAVQALNYWALRQAPTLDDPDVGAAGLRFRAEAGKRWDAALRHRQRYTTIHDGGEWRALLWTQLVLVWQCVGRLLRGGVSARVHFVDARWSEGGAGDSFGTDTAPPSMLAGFRLILREALEDPDPARRAVATALYGDFAHALDRMKGLTHA
jgi:hypothetical protein